jgi:hypothetical protein
MTTPVACAIGFLLLSAPLAACGDDDGGGGGGGADGGGGGGPSVSATADPTAVVPGGEVTVTVSVDNFILEAPSDTNVDGHGHYHVYLDDASGADYLAADFAASVVITIPAETPLGAHTLKVTLQENDHSPLGISDTVNIDVVQTGGPAVSATADPSTLGAGETTTLTITTTDFTLVAPGGANVDGQGHYHVYLDDASGADYLAADFTPTVDVDIPGGTDPGPHTLEVTLSNNDHSPLSPPVMDIVDIMIQ